MNKMKGLFYRDVFAMGMFSYIVAIVPVICLAVTLFIGDVSFYSLTVFLIISLEFPMSALLNSCSDNWIKYQTFLPVSRKAAVNFKYYQLIIRGLFCLIITELAVTGGALFRGDKPFGLVSVMIFFVVMISFAGGGVSLSFGIFGHRNLSFVSFVLIVMSSVVLMSEILCGEVDWLKDNIFELKNSATGSSFSYLLIIFLLSAAVTAAVWFFTAYRYSRKDL